VLLGLWVTQEFEITSRPFVLSVFVVYPEGECACACGDIQIGDYSFVCALERRLKVNPPALKCVYSSGHRGGFSLLHSCASSDFMDSGVLLEQFWCRSIVATLGDFAQASGPGGSFNALLCCSICHKCPTGTASFYCGDFRYLCDPVACVVRARGGGRQSTVARHLNQLKIEFLDIQSMCVAWGRASSWSCRSQKPLG
jgi:hypothetical protein